VKKVQLWSAVLAAILVMAAAPALAQDGDSTPKNVNFNCTANGGTAIADASGGQASVTQYAAGGQYSVINQYASASANGGVAIADASGGDVLCILRVNNSDIVTGDSVVVNRTVFRGVEVPVFEDEAGLVFVVANNSVVPIDEEGIVAGTEDAAGATAVASAAPAAETSTVAASLGLEVLPDTGGVSAITLGSCVLLITGGLLARRFIR
jgi:hypothetical protein